MKLVVWSSYSFEDSYAEYHIMEERLKAYAASGFDIILIQKSFHKGKKLPESLKSYSKIKTVDIPFEQPEKLSFAKRYLSEIKYYSQSSKAIPKDTDAIFIQSSFAAWKAVRISKKKKLKVIYNVQDIFPNDAVITGKLSESSPIYKVLRSFQRKAYMSSNRVVTISEDLKKTLQNETGGKKQIDVIYNWSYQNEPYRIADKDNHFLKKHGINRKDCFRVVYAGNIGQMMDADMLLSTAERLREYKDIKFFLIGGGSNEQYIRQQVEEEHLENVALYPFQPIEYAPDNYCMADVNINPVPKGVIYTCMPSKTATCLLSEKPTVVSLDLDSDMANRLQKVDQWTVVAPGDDKAMAEAILQYYKDIDWRNGEEKRSRNAAQFLKELGPVENAYQYVDILKN